MESLRRLVPFGPLNRLRRPAAAPAPGHRDPGRPAARPPNRRSAAIAPGRLPAALGLAVALATAPVAGAAERRQPGFDFYVLALSWSPSFCLTRGGEKDGLQCAPGAGHGFIVHGLWPQYESGYPSYCPSREPERVPEAMARPLLSIAPSLGLIGHMWRKHGSCSGLRQAAYFDLVRKAFARISVPPAFRDPDAGQTWSAPAVEAAFMAANPGLRADAIAAACEGGRLQEIRICLTDKLDFRPCREVDAKGCQARSLTVPPPG